MSSSVPAAPTPAADSDSGLRALAEAATPGPWSTSGPDTVGQWTVYDGEWAVASAQAYDHDQPYSNEPDARGPGYIDPDANAAFIAAASPDAVIALLDRLDEAAVLLMKGLHVAEALGARAEHLQGALAEIAALHQMRVGRDGEGIYCPACHNGALDVSRHERPCETFDTASVAASASPVPPPAEGTER